MPILRAPPPAGVPLRPDPAPVETDGLVGGREVRWQTSCLDELARERRLPDLPRPRENLDESTRLEEPRERSLEDGPAEEGKM